MHDMNSTPYEENAGSKGAKWLGKIIAIVCILIVAAFGDVMYIILMQAHFPAGPIMMFCYLGAFTSFLATVYLLIGKSVLFTPGKQMAFSWLVLGIELVLIAMNIVLVSSGAQASEFTTAWANWVAPITPVINMVGIVILLFLDEEQLEKHADMELRSFEMKIERDYKKAMLSAGMKLRYKQMNYLTAELERATDNPGTLAILRDHAAEMSNGLLTNLTGRSYSRAAKVVDADQPRQVESVSLARTEEMSIGRLEQLKKLFSGKEEPIVVTPTPEPVTKSSAGRKLTDAEINEAIRTYHETGEMPEGWSSRRMKAYIRHRYPKTETSKHDNI